MFPCPGVWLKWLSSLQVINTEMGEWSESHTICIGYRTEITQRQFIWHQTLESNFLRVSTVQSISLYCHTAQTVNRKVGHDYMDFSISIFILKIYFHTSNSLIYFSAIQSFAMPFTMKFFYFNSLDRTVFLASIRAGAGCLLQ